VRGGTGKGANRVCFLERKMALRKWRKTEPVAFFRLLFLWFVSFGGAKEMNIEKL
jgi:hypothetical protein